MPSETLDEIERLARAATPSPWIATLDRKAVLGDTENAEGFTNVTGKPSPADVAYLAALSPSLVRSLVGLARNESPMLWTEEALREPLEWALNKAWDDFVTDTGCYPECITVVKKRGGAGVGADFRLSNFSSFAAGWLAFKLNESPALRAARSSRTLTTEETT